MDEHDSSRRVVPGCAPTLFDCHPVVGVDSKNLAKRFTPVVLRSALAGHPRRNRLLSDGEKFAERGLREAAEFHCLSEGLAPFCVGEGRSSHTDTTTPVYVDRQELLAKDYENERIGAVS